MMLQWSFIVQHVSGTYSSVRSEIVSFKYPTNSKKHALRELHKSQAVILKCNPEILTNNFCTKSFVWTFSFA